jgi:myo-inositol-1(or 4)-monophosphatase
MFAALQRTGSFLRRDFGEVENLQQSLSGARDFVQKAAVKIEESILSDLILVRPAAGVLTPNYSTDGDGVSEFVLALSGAVNFVRGNPHFAISLALRVNEETRIGLIYSPIDEKLYYSENGDGTFSYSAFHSNRVNVSRQKEDSDLTIGLGSAAVSCDSRFTTYDSRLTGCPALDLAWVAAGKFDAFVGEPLDYAEICAGELLVNQAGGKVYESEGQLFATNGLVKF